MTDFGVTEEGFNGKRLADIIEEAETDLSAIVDPVSGENLAPDLDSDDPSMQIALVPLVSVSDAWESTKLVFDQFDPSKATGPSLSGLVQINGIGRLLPIASTDTANLGGAAGTLIEAGKIISDEFLTQEWTTDTDVTLDGTGNAVVGITSTITGPVIAQAGLLNRIITPVVGWQTVSNVGAVVVGRDEEADDALRVRRNRSTLAPAASPAESVFSNLRNLEGVTFVKVLINNTLEPDERGIPGKNQAVVIIGGDDEEIATTILQRSGSSVEFFGSTLVTFFDIQEVSVPVRFTRPVGIVIFIKLQIEITNATLFPGDGDQLIKDAIVIYVKEGADAVGVLNGFNQVGFGPGSNLIRTRLFTPINSIDGHKITLLEIGLDPGNTSEIDIQTAFDEFPDIIADNIDITVIS